MTTMGTNVVILFILLLFTETLAVPAVNPHDANNECRVQECVRLNTNNSTSLLAYIRQTSFIQLSVFFKDKESLMFRDDISLSNTVATLNSVREGETKKTDHPTSMIIPEGWSFLTMVAEEHNLEIMYQEVSLLQLPFDFQVQTITLWGILSLCSEGNPSWEVVEGKEIEVPLQPETLKHRIQPLQVIGLNESKSYISFLKDHRKTDIPVNVKMFTNITMRHSHTSIAVNEKDVDKPIATTTQHIRYPLRLKVGSRKGNVTIIFHTPTTDEHQCDQHLQHNYILYITVIGSVLGAFIILLLAYVIWLSLKFLAFRRVHSDRKHNNVPDERDEPLLPNRRMTQIAKAGKVTNTFRKHPNCRCGCCPEKVINGNSKCCRDIEKFNKAISNTSYLCITEHEGFQTYCIDKNALRASYFYAKNTTQEHGSPKHFRSAAFKQLNICFFNEGDTYDVSDCVCSVIRKVYPEKDDKNYEGFKMTD